MRSVMCKVLLFALIILVICLAVEAKKSSPEEKPDWAKKDFRFYSDADLERLYDQWEEDDEPLEPDELPEHLRPAPKIDMSKFDPKNPETILRASKKDKMLMTFVNVNGNPTRDETEQITTLWQSSLMNNHIVAERFLIDDARAIFTFKDGSQAWDAKDFLVQQDRLESITIENKPYFGKNSQQKGKDEL